VPHVKPSSPGGRVVKKTLADGTIKVYRYSAYAPKPAAAGARTLSKLIADWQLSPEWRKLAEKSRDTYTRNILPLLHPDYAALEASAITRHSLIELRNEIAKKRGDGAAAAFLNAVGSLWAYALDNEWTVLPGITARLRKPLHEGEYPAWDEGDLQLALTVARLPERLRRALILASYTGQRRGDLMAMSWDDYDGERIRLVQIKTGVKLSLPCPIELRVELDAWKAEASVVGLNGKPEGTILRCASGEPWEGTNLSAQLNIHLAKIPGFRAGLNIHGCRKYAAAMLAAAGCTPHEIMSITGHSTLAMVELYTKSVEQQRLSNSAAGKLAAYRVKTGT
jgi:integrase